MLKPLNRSTLGDTELRFDTGGLLVAGAVHPGAIDLPRHEHADAYVCVVLGGGYEEHGRTTVDCNRGSVVLHPAGHVHGNRFHASGARVLNLHPARDWLGEGPFTRLLADYRHLRFDPRADAFARMERELAAGDAAAALGVTAAAFELFAAIIRLDERKARPSWLARIVDMLESDLAHTPSLAELAVQAGVHPSHLARAFRAARGETVGEYLRRRRLDQADSALVGGRVPIGEIALAAGFYDQAHFTRAFRQRFRVTPLQRRREVQSRY